MTIHDFYKVCSSDETITVYPIPLYNKPKTFCSMWFYNKTFLAKEIDFKIELKKFDLDLKMKN